MPLQLNIWLLLFGSLQGLLLFFVLVKKRTYRQGYSFLIPYLLVMLAQILFKILDKQWLLNGSPETYFLSYKFPFLYGPLAWLFVRRLVQGQKFSLFNLLHFVPFLYSVVVINIRHEPGVFSWLYWPMESLPALLLQTASLVYYHVLSFRIWQQHKQQLQNSYSDLYKKQVINEEKMLRV